LNCPRNLDPEEVITGSEHALQLSSHLFLVRGKVLLRSLMARAFIILDSPFFTVQSSALGRDFRASKPICDDISARVPVLVSKTPMSTLLVCTDTSGCCAGTSGWAVTLLVLFEIGRALYH
jgi:hypothetical protein